MTPSCCALSLHPLHLLQQDSDYVSCAVWMPKPSTAKPKEWPKLSQICEWLGQWKFMLLLRTLASPNSGIGISENYQQTRGVMTPLCPVLCRHPLQLEINSLQQDSTEIPKCSPGSGRHTGLKIPKSLSKCPRFVNGFTSGSAGLLIGNAISKVWES